MNQTETTEQRVRRWAWYRADHEHEPIVCLQESETCRVLLEPEIYTDHDGAMMLRLVGERGDPDADILSLIAAAPQLLEALVMVRDADDDCRKDGLPTIPGPARAKIDAAIAKARRHLQSPRSHTMKTYTEENRINTTYTRDGIVLEVDADIETLTRSYSDRDTQDDVEAVVTRLSISGELDPRHLETPGSISIDDIIEHVLNQ